VADPRNWDYLDIKNIQITFSLVYYFYLISSRNLPTIFPRSLSYIGGPKSKPLPNYQNIV